MAGSEPLSAVVATGGHRASLEALRDDLARALEVVDADKKAPLANQLRAVLSELANLPAEKGRSTFDDLAARRRDRKPKAAGL